MERPPSREISPKEEAVSVMREKGVADPESLAVLTATLDDLDARVERGEVSNLDRNIQWAELYRDAGWTEQAREAYADAEEQAYQKGDEDRRMRCVEELEKLA